MSHVICEYDCDGCRAVFDVDPVGLRASAEPAKHPPELVEGHYSGKYRILSKCLPRKTPVYLPFLLVECQNFVVVSRLASVVSGQS